MKISGSYSRSKDYLKGKKPFKVTHELREKVILRLKELLKQREEILLAILFGSFIRSNFARDVDLAVYLNKIKDLYDALEYSETLAKILEKELKLPFDVIVLNIADEGLLMRVILNGVKIVERDPLLYYGLRMLALEVRNRFTKRYEIN